MKKAGNDRSLRAILATKTKRSLWDVARHLYGFAGAERTAKAELVDFLAREIVAQPLLIAASFPPIDQEVGEALWSAFQWGSARMEYAFDNHKRILRELSFVSVKQDGEDDIVVYVPDEICKLYADEEIREVWKEHFDDNNTIDDLVRACVLRYGHVTVGEILALGVKWCGFQDAPEMKVAIKRVIGGRSRTNYGDADYCMLGDAVMHLSVCGRNVREFARLAPDFVARRKPYPRWWPKTLAEFLEVLDDDYYEKTPATHRLIDLLCGEFENDPEIVDEFFVDLTELVTAGDDLKNVVKLMGFLGIVVPKSADRRVMAAIQDFANHARLRWLNGHTPAEVGETYRPLDADKVIYADDIDASDLRFPVILPDADGSDLDNLDDELETDEPYEEEDEDDDNFLDDFEDDYEDYDGPQEPIRRDQPRIGRNDPCPCGSGKKYKKCCGRNA